MLKRHCKRKYRLTFLFLIFGLTVFGQDIQLDQLESDLKEQSGIPKVNILNKLSVAYSTRDPKRALNYANHAYALATAIRDARGQIQSTYNAGMIHVKGNNNMLAIDYFNKGLHKAIKANDLHFGC